MTQQLSNCCKAQVSVSSSDEGTSCFMCSECKWPCDLHHEAVKEKSLKLTEEESEILYEALIIFRDKEWSKTLFVQDFLQRHNIKAEKELSQLFSEDDILNLLTKKLIKVMGEFEEDDLQNERAS